MSELVYLEKLITGDTPYYNLPTDQLYPEYYLPSMGINPDTIISTGV